MRIRHLALTAWLLGASLAAQAWDAARIRQQAQALPAAAQARTHALLAVVEAQRDHPLDQQLAAVNDFFNSKLNWRDDQEVWGVVDYWASPLELLSKGAGDCEDLAMGKYFALLALGLPESGLRLVYVRAQWQGKPQAHMVLAWYPPGEAEPWILDNLDPRLRRASERSDLQPVFSFNAQGLWQGAGAVTQGNPMTRLTIWRDALAKARAEGFAP